MFQSLILIPSAKHRAIEISKSSARSALRFLRYLLFKKKNFYRRQQRMITGGMFQLTVSLSFQPFISISSSVKIKRKTSAQLLTSTNLCVLLLKLEDFNKSKQRERRMFQPFILKSIERQQK